MGSGLVERNKVNSRALLRTSAHGHVVLFQTIRSRCLLIGKLEESAPNHGSTKDLHLVTRANHGFCFC